MNRDDPPTVTTCPTAPTVDHRHDTLCRPTTGSPRWTEQPPAGPAPSPEPGRSPLVRLLDLRPHPEGGWYRETWRTGPHTRLRPPGYSGLRTAASGIYYCLEPGEESRWHRVLSDELWLWHRGGPLTLRLAGDGPAPDPGRETTVTLGPEIEAGHHPQYLVPSGHWQAARPRSGEEVLVSCVVAPGFAYEDFTLAHGPTGRGTPADPAE